MASPAIGIRCQCGYNTHDRRLSQNEKNYSPMHAPNEMSPSSTAMNYDSSSYRKHKRPGGWGSICPSMTQEEAQELLNTSVEAGGARYNIDGNYCYQSFCHVADGSGETFWHGFPIPWQELPREAKNLLIAKKRLTNVAYMKAIRKSLGAEFRS